MKRITLIVVISVVAFATALLAFAMQAHAALACSVSTRVEMALTARMVALPDAPSFSAKGQGEICYSIDGKSAKLVSESVPRLVYESQEPPAGLKALTVFVETMPGTHPVVGWKNWPDVTLTGADLRVRAYEVPAAQVQKESKPIVDIVLPELALSTKPITVEGEDSKGFIDDNTVEALLVGEAKLPDAEFGPYNEALAGHAVLTELYVKLQNPYVKGAGGGEGDAAPKETPVPGSAPAPVSAPAEGPSDKVPPIEIQKPKLLFAPIVYDTGFTLQRASHIEASSAQ